MSRTTASLALMAVLAHPWAAAQSTPAVPAQSGAFARVGETVITNGEYDAALAVAQRNRFYHRQAPEAQVLQLKREVGDELINRVLLFAEAKRRNLAADQARVQSEIDAYEKRYSASPQWPRMKAEMLPALTAELERRSVLQQLEAAVREVAAPNEEALRRFHSERIALFTEPAQVRLSVILLKVEPAAARAVWDSAREEGAAIRARLARGADFAELARLHSGDDSAERGGDMGYLHRGMLPDTLQEIVDKIPPGEVSAPITLLEGVALVRVEDRKPAQVRDFDSVRERALQLWRREEGDRAWRALIARLRAATPVEVVDASRYPQVPAEPAAAPTR